MRVSKLENRFCPTCGRTETAEVTYEVEPLLGGEVDRTAIKAECRQGHGLDV
jgi:hypothetical protein